jgi:GT2 family glycosyltransferase
MLVHDREEPFEVDWVCGAAMLVRREIIGQIGVLDTTFDPIYSEEIDWCYRIKQASWEIWVLPEAQIIHYGGRTMNRAMPRKYRLLLSHKALFFRKHKGQAAAAIYKAMLALSTSGKLLWWTCKSLLDGDREHCKERMRLHHYVLTRIPSL